MTTHTQDQADADLRALLAQADPEVPTSAAVPPHLLDRVQAAVAADPVGPPMPSAAWPHPLAGAPDDDEAGARTAGGRAPLARPRWQPWLLAAAGITSLALAAGTVLPGLLGSGSDAGLTSEESAASGPVAGAAGMDATTGGGAPAVGEAAADAAVPSQDRAATGQDETENTLVRSASMLVGVEEVGPARDAFVAEVLSTGGRVTSETVVAEGDGGAQPLTTDLGMASDLSMPPWPWYPSGPGVWLTVQVPEDRYEDTVESARALGEVVQLQQSSYDVGAQKTEVDTRIAALEASLERLTALMDEASDISDVIALEQAIAQRQAELDALRAQQRELANQTAMSMISLTLMTPEDAQQLVDPQPSQTWWESFLAGLGQAWSWLGRALLIVSPLLLAWAVIAWWRRRARRRPTAQPVAAEPVPDPQAPTSS